MRFTTGTKQDLDKSEFKDFDVFDYVIDHNGNPSLKHIDNGNDGEGIGIYAFIGDSEEAITKAGCYTSEESAFAYILDVDIEDSDLMNYREPDEIPIEDLSNAIQSFMNKLRNQKGFDKDIFDNIVNSIGEDFSNYNYEEINEILKENDLSLEIDEYACPSEFEDFFDWEQQMQEQYEMNDPCSNVMEEGGPEAVAEYAVSKANNLWETIKYIGQNIAIHHTQKGTERYNKTFQQAIVTELSDYNLVASYVNNDKFAVIFNTDEIDIIEKIDLNQKLKQEKKSKLKP